MTDIEVLLESVGIPVEEVTHKKGTKLPYIVYNESDNNRGSDDKNLLVERSIRLELYTSKKDREIENKIESILDNKGIEFQKGDTTVIDKDYYMLTPFYFDLVERNGNFG